MPLRESIWAWRTDTVAALLELGATQAADDDGYTPLMDASRIGAAEIVALLLGSLRGGEEGGVEARDLVGWPRRSFLAAASPRALASCEWKRTAAAQGKSAHGATLTPAQEGKTALAWAAATGNQDCLCALLGAGADIETVDDVRF